MSNPNRSGSAPVGRDGAAAHLPFEVIVSRLKMRPGMIEHLEGIDLDGDGLPDIPPLSGQPPMDPAGRMRWQAMLAEHQRRAQVRRGRSAQRKEANNQVLLAHLQASDPLFQAVHLKVGEFVRSLPMKLQRPFLQAVDQTPGAYLDLYKEMRDLIALALRHGGVDRSSSAHAGRFEPAEGQDGTVDPRAAVRRAVSGRMSPPALENAGVMDDRLPGATRDAELADLKARCKAGKARDGDLLRYLELNWRGQE